MKKKKCWATGGHFQGLLCYFCIAVRLFLIPGVKGGKKKSSVFLNYLELLGMWLLECLAQTYKNVMNIYQPRTKSTCLPCIISHHANENTNGISIALQEKWAVSTEQELEKKIKFLYKEYITLLFYYY